jgi:hypothetical protein
VRLQPARSHARWVEDGSGGRIRTADTRIMIPVARPETANIFAAMSRLCRKQCPLGGRELRPVIVRREQVTIAIESHHDAGVT